MQPGAGTTISLLMLVKEMIVYFRWSRAVHYSQHINSEVEEITGSLRLMGVYITNKLLLAMNASSFLKHNSTSTS